MYNDQGPRMRPHPFCAALLCLVVAAGLAANAAPDASATLWEPVSAFGSQQEQPDGAFATFLVPRLLCSFGRHCVTCVWTCLTASCRQSLTEGTAGPLDSTDMVAYMDALAGQRHLQQAALQAALPIPQTAVLVRRVRRQSGYCFMLGDTSSASVSCCRWSDSLKVLRIFSFVGPRRTWRRPTCPARRRTRSCRMLETATLSVRILMSTGFCTAPLLL